MVQKLIRVCVAGSILEDKPEYYDLDKLYDDPVFWGAKGVELLEDMGSMMQETGKRIIATAEAVRKVYTDLVEMNQKMMPLMGKIIDDVSRQRAYLVEELSEALNEYKEVRKFFIHDDHQKSIENIKEFCEIADKLRKLMDDGTLKAVTDMVKKEVK